jgi:hypothetical protein
MFNPVIISLLMSISLALNLGLQFFSISYKLITQLLSLRFYLFTEIHHHHQPINIPTPGAEAFLMDHPLGERAITHYAGPVRIGG